jgi:hypothetical protein
MNQQQAPQQSNDLKSLPFALFPFGIVVFLILIGLWQNSTVKKISAVQNVSAETINAETNTHSDLKKCFIQLSYRIDGIDRLTEKQANDRLFDCREELKRRS